MAPKLRFLPPEEYYRLESTALEHQPDPDHSLVIVGEDTETIISHWVASEALVLDGLWVDPNYRNTFISGRMAITMLDRLKTLGASGVLTVTSEPSVTKQAERLGFRPIPGVVSHLRF